MRKEVLKIKELFDKGAFPLASVNKLLDADKITQEEYIFIVGENN